MAVEVVAFATLALVVLGAGAWTDRVRKQALEASYWSRPSQIEAWRARYPDVDAARIDAYLAGLCDAFAFSPERAVRFHPGDGLMEIYETDQTGYGVDICQLEEFCDFLEATHGGDFEATLRTPGVTLGQIFETTRAAGNQVGS